MEALDTPGQALEDCRLHSGRRVAVTGISSRRTAYIAMLPSEHLGLILGVSMRETDPRAIAELLNNQRPTNRYSISR